MARASSNGNKLHEKHKLAKLQTKKNSFEIFSKGVFKKFNFVKFSLAE